MKKILIAALAATAFAGTASAQANNNGVVGSVVMNLKANVAEICGAVDYLNPVDVDFGELSTVLTSATVEKSNGLTIVCNDAAGGKVTIASANAGKLLRNGALTGNGNEIGYTVSSTGGSGLSPLPGGTSLATPKEITFNGSTAFVAGQSMTLKFAVNGVLQANVSNINDGERTTVYAGAYSDIVTVSVTSN